MANLPLTAVTHNNNTSQTYTKRTDIHQACVCPKATLYVVDKPVATLKTLFHEAARLSGTLTFLKLLGRTRLGVSLAHNLCRWTRWALLEIGGTISKFKLSGSPGAPICHPGGKKDNEPLESTGWKPRVTYSCAPFRVPQEKPDFRRLVQNNHTSNKSSDNSHNSTAFEHHLATS